jgi:hypothetical protein
MSGVVILAALSRFHTHAYVQLYNSRCLLHKMQRRARQLIAQFFGIFWWRKLRLTTIRDLPIILDQ